MRTAHRKAHLLPLLLLSLYSVSVCLAVRCTFDGFVEKLGALNIATAVQQPTGKKWEHLRIVASTEDLKGPSKYCKNEDESIHERSTKSADADCKGIFDAVDPEDNTILMGILAKAITLHSERLLVQRLVGPLKIPDLSKTEGCKYFSIPADHYTTGVANADMVLYVASNDDLDGRDGAQSFALTCAKSAGGRPIAGALTFGSGNAEVSRTAVRLTTHQIAHALGFSYSAMKSRNMIVDKTVREKPNQVAVVNSEKTKEMARVHYGCSTAEGMELEDGEKNDKKLSHWERRNAKDELMATPLGVRGTSFMGFYSNITLAAFEDMGFYKANFPMAEHMEYGHNKGCEFLEGKCMDKGNTKWSNIFCDAATPNVRPYACNTDRLGLGICILKEDYTTSLPAHFQYFTSDKRGGYSWPLTDYCPVVEHDPSVGCVDSKEHGNVHGNLYGKNSMCLDGNALKVKTTNGIFSTAGVCAEILCEGGSILVKYLGEKRWVDCPAGQSITPSSTSTSFDSGTIKCPKYEEVCTVAPDGISLVPKFLIESPTTAAPTGPGKPNGKPNDPNSGGKSKDGSSVPFGLIPSVAFLVLSFTGYLIA